MATVMLKVKVMQSATESRMLTFNLPAMLSVGEANEQIGERSHEESWTDMALFRVVDTPQPLTASTSSNSRSFLGRKKDKKDQTSDVPYEPVGIWLNPNKSLGEYDLSTDDELVFRKCHKVITVKTADESCKAVIVDLTRPVKEVLAAVGKKFGLDRTEEYALQWERTGKWLKSGRPLTEQGNSNEVLVLRKRYYVTDAQLDASSPVQLHLAYIQGRDMVVSGLHPVTKEETIQFAALQAQAQYGIFNPQIHKLGFLDLTHFVPPTYLKIKDLETAILQAWKSVGNLTVIEAKHKYHQLCMTLATYGKTMYSVEVNEAPKGKKPQLVPYKLAFSATMVQQLTSDCKTVVRQHKYNHVRKWEHTENDILLDFGDHDPQSPVVYITPEGEEIAMLIGGYVDILVRINRSLRAEGKMKGAIAEVQAMSSAKTKVSVGVIAEGSGTFEQALATITDLNTFRETFHSYHVPTVKELGAPPVGMALTNEQISTQMDSSSLAIRKAMAELQKTAASHNAQELSNLAKNLALIVANFLKDAQRAATISKELSRKQQLLTSCGVLVNSLETYAEALKAYEADTTGATAADLEKAKCGVELALEGVISAMRSNNIEPENGCLLGELARNVETSVQQMINTAKKAAPGNAGVEDACKKAQISCDELRETVKVLGLYASDPAMRERLTAKMRQIKPATSDILQSVSQANPGSMPTVMTDMKNVDSELREMQLALEDTAPDLLPKLLPYYRAAHSVMYESAKISSNPENMEQIKVSTSFINDNAPIIMARAKEMNDEVTDANDMINAPNHMNTLALARQIAIAANMLDQQSAPDAEVNSQLIQKSGVALNQAVTNLLGDEELLMHKVVLVDRSKQAIASVLRIVHAAEDNIRAGKVPAEKNEEMTMRCRGTFEAVQQMLVAIKQAVGTEGDERLNINNLAEMAAFFCQGAAVNVIFPMNSEGPDYAEVCTTAGRDVQSLLEEIQQYRIVGRLADIEYATESFRAAEAVLQAILFANDADYFTKFGTREEALEMLPAAASQFGNSLKSVATAVKNSESFVDPLSDLSRATQTIISVARGLITNSRFKHERTLLVDAARELTIDINKLIDALKRFAREDTNGVVDAVATSIAGSVSALQRMVVYAQNEGGQLILEEGNDFACNYDAELEAQAAEVLMALKDQVDSVHEQISGVSAALPPPTDPRSTVNTAIVDSVSALVASSGAVVSAACEIQNELVENLDQPTSRIAYARDPNLADALIKAAHHVQSSIIDLTRGISEDTIQTLSQSELATHACAVSKSVEILATAVRAGLRQRPTSLIEATATVGEATQSLLEAAKMIEEIPAEEEDDTDVENFGIDAYTLQEIKMQMKIVELEHSVEKARKKYDKLMNTSLVKAQWNVV